MKVKNSAMRFVRTGAYENWRRQASQHVRLRRIFMLLVCLATRVKSGMEARRELLKISYQSQAGSKTNKSTTLSMNVDSLAALSTTEFEEIKIS